jgi:hypothetical protein
MLSKVGPPRSGDSALAGCRIYNLENSACLPLVERAALAFLPVEEIAPG